MGTDTRGTPSKQPSSSVYIIKALIAFAAERGADTGALTRAAGLDAGTLDSEHARVPLAVLNDLWNGIAGVLDDPLPGLLFGEAFGRRSEGHFLFVIMSNCETLHKAIKSLIRYHGLMTDIVRPVLSVSGGKARLALEYRFDRAAVAPHLADAVLALLATVLKRLTGGAIAFEKVCLAHPAPVDRSRYARLFGREPVFGAGGDAMEFDACELRRTFPLAHREFSSLLHHYADVLDSKTNESIRFSDRTALLLKKSILGGEDCTLGAVAKRFGMSARHLQNKLKDEGTRYSTLRDGVRKEIAEHYLRRNDVMLCDIAFLLGFSEQSSFNHAFKKWTGHSPREYRNKNRPQ